MDHLIHRLVIISSSHFGFLINPLHFIHVEQYCCGFFTCIECMSEKLDWNNSDEGSILIGTNDLFRCYLEIMI